MHSDFAETGKIKGFREVRRAEWGFPLIFGLRRNDDDALTVEVSRS
jgi:hypothetical protein